MSTTIDQKVVEMRFDNKHFEDNVQTSLKSIDKLKQGLNFDGASKGLENVSSAARGVNMSGLSGAVETVHAKFSALEVMAVTALANITNSAVNTGKRIVSALTIDPIKTGLSEYETQINAVQTIMANTESKGTTLDDVNKALDELNTYADKTIYNFTEMTRNIGTFTAAGVDLDTSVSAIQGIANLAAVSGSSSQQASTAMYQLSQALAAGKVSLMDWNSVVNAGMGGQVFQDALIRTAAALDGSAKNVDAWRKSNIDAYGSFRESLTQGGWLTTDVLTTTLKQFTLANTEANKQMLISQGYTEDQATAILKMAETATDAATKVKTFSQLWDTLKETAQSGWTQTWEIMFGDFEEAKNFFSDLYNTLSPIIEASSAARNELLKGWKDAGGRTDLIESMYNLFEAISSVVKPIKEAFRDIFPPTTVNQLVSLTEGLKNFTEKLKLGSAASDKLKRTFKGLFAILDIVRQVFVAIFAAIFPVVGGLDDLGGGILTVTATIGDWLVKLRDAIKSSGVFYKGMQIIVTGIKLIAGVMAASVEKIKEFGTALKEKFNFPGLEIFHKLLEKVHSGMSKVGEIAGTMSSGVIGAVGAMGSFLAGCSFFKVMQAIWTIVKTIGSGIAKILGTVAGGIIDTLGNANFDGILSILNTILAGGLGIGIMKFLKGLSEPLEGLSGLLEGVTGILDGVRGCFEAYQTQLKAGALLKIAAAIAILTASILVISMIDSEKLAASLGAVTMLFADLMASMSIFGKISGNVTGVGKTCAAMISISVAVLILASALKKVSDIESDKMATGLLGIVGLTAVVIAAAKILGSGKKAIIKGATQMVIFAAAIKILASVCEDLSKLSWEEMVKGLVGVGVLLAEVSIFLNTAKFSGQSISTATGIVILAAAIKILASACADFGQMKWSEISNGLVAIGALLLEIAVFTKLTGNSKNVISTSIALIAIGAAMKIFASAAIDIAQLSWNDLAKGLVGMAGALISVAIATRIMPKNMITVGIGLIAVSTALVIMANVLDKMGSMSWESIAKGMVLLGGSILTLSIGLKAMSGSLAGSAALLIAANALLIITPVLAILGAMSWTAIAKGLITVAGAFAIIGVAAMILKPLTVTILALSASFALLGLSVVAIGVGLLAIGAGLSAIAIGVTTVVTSVAGGAAAIVTALTIIVSGIASLIPVIIKRIGEGIVEICKVFSDGAPAIGEAIKAIVLTVVDVLVECVPVIADGALKLMVGILDALITYAPQLIPKLFEFIVILLEGVASNLPALIGGVVDILMSFFSGVLDALGQIDLDTILKGTTAVALLTGIMLGLGAAASMIPSAMIGVLGLGAVLAELSIVLAAVGALGKIPGLNTLISSGGDFLQIVGTAIGQFIGGIVGGIAGGITSKFPEIANDLAAFMTNIKPFIDGAKSIDTSILTGVAALAGAILILTAANLIDGIVSWITGGVSLSEFGTEIASFGPSLKQYADSVKGIDIASVKASAEAAKALAEMSNTIPNEGGVVSWFAGENSLSKFSGELVTLGVGLKGFADKVSGIDPLAIMSAATAAKALVEITNLIPNSGGVASWFAGDNSISKFGEDLVALGTGLKRFSVEIDGANPEAMTAAAGAAKAIAEMSNHIPNSGGVASWFTGDNSISKFGKDLVALGEGLKGFAVAIDGIDPETIVAASNAAKALAEMTTYIPNSGGIASWFAGDNSVSKFGKDLVALGEGLKGFSVAIEGVNPETIVAAANAAKALAEMTSYIPNEGGVVSWFTGDNSLSKFSTDLISLGMGLKGFATSVEGINPETTLAAANAAKAIAEMSNYIPNEGGVVSWFAGENSLSKFGTDLIALGVGLKGFATSVEGINPETTLAAANAGKILAEMTSYIPNEGGVVSWFAGENSVSKFGTDLVSLGQGLKGFADQVTGINPEALLAAANAAKSLVDMTAYIPNEGGVTSWFAGDNSVANFGASLIDLGRGMKGFSDSVSGINPESTTAAANSAKALAEMASYIPNSGGVVSWFAGDGSVANFSGELVTLGEGLKGFSSAVAGVNPEAITSAANAAKALAQMTSYIPNSGGIASWFAGESSIANFSSELVDLGRGLKQFSTEVAGVNTSHLASATTQFEKVVNLAKGVSGVNFDGMSNFGQSLGNLGKTGIDEFIKAFEDAETRIRKAGSNIIDQFLKGVETAAKNVQTTFSKITKTAVEALERERRAFYDAGMNLVAGFADGISANTFAATAKAKAMAEAAADAARKALDEHSPSRVGYEIGDFFGVAFVNAIGDYVPKAYDASSEMADSARKGLGNAISRLTNTINSDMDMQPTIRPVLDLSNIETGKNAISSMLGLGSSFGLLTNVGAVNTMMNRYVQNGGTSEVVSAINRLRKDLDKVGNTSYNINGITYDDGSNIANAVETIVRAAKIERRV